MSGEFLFFVQLPDPRELCHAVLKVADNSNNNKFHNQVVKCRQLILLCREVLASPQIDDMSLIDVVMQVCFYKSKFASACKRLNLKPIHAATVKNVVLERCMMYSIKFRMEPQWVQVGQILVNNSAFLTCQGKMNAISLKVKVCGKDMTVQIRPHLIRLPPPSLESFGICTEALLKFSEDSSFIITEFSINLSWCHILPSMKLGQIVQISRKMPVEGNTLFKDYDGMRKYWKNQYGYQLPREDCDVIYCSVYLKLLSEHLFTYPLLCLRSKKIQHMPRCDELGIVKGFISNMHVKVDKVCGTALKYARQPYFPTSCLTSSLQATPTQPPNVQVGEFTWSTVSQNVHQVPELAPKQASNKILQSQNQQVPCSQNIIQPSQKTEFLMRKEGEQKNAIPSKTNCAEYKITSSVDISTLEKFPRSSSGKFIPMFGSVKSTCKKIQRTPLQHDSIPAKRKTSGNSEDDHSHTKVSGSSGSLISATIKKSKELINDQRVNLPKHKNGSSEQFAEMFQKAGSRSNTKTFVEGSCKKKAKRRKKIVSPSSVDNQIILSDTNKGNHSGGNVQEDKSLDKVFDCVASGKRMLKTGTRHSLKPNLFDSIFSPASGANRNSSTPKQLNQFHFEKLTTIPKFDQNSGICVQTETFKPGNAKYFDQMFSSARH